MIEFQCKEKHGKVDFTGFNFYTRAQNPEPSVVDEMIESARKQGLGVYMDSGRFRGLTNVSQTNCSYTPIQE